MKQSKKQFFSCVDSRILDNGELYARFHFGSFFRGQALTVANALRRTLLTESPSVVLKKVQISGITHEFSTLPGVQETILDLLLNLRKLVFTAVISDLKDYQSLSLERKAFLKARGPKTITAADIKLPPNLKCVSADSYIATLSAFGELNLIFEFEFLLPQERHAQNTQTALEIDSNSNHGNVFLVHQSPNSIKKINYFINSLDDKRGSEYIALEIWTDGSLTPTQILHFAFNQLTNIFYTFTQDTQNIIFK